MRIVLYPLLFAACLFLAACSDQPAARQDASYDETKKMVVDILQTDEGKKALSDVITDDKVKAQLVMDSDDTKKTIADTLTSDKGKEMWATLFKDPDFRAGFAESMEAEQTKLIKALMHDPDYQKQMLELLQNPEIKELNLQTLKGEKFRSHLQETIQQTMQTPAFQKQMHDLLLEAVQKQNEQSKQDKG